MKEFVFVGMKNWWLAILYVVLNTDRVKGNIMPKGRELTPCNFSDSAAYSAGDCANKACATLNYWVKIKCTAM
jgi:hypothetical protein